MRPLKLFRRADDRPTLKDRATALKARLAQITKRRDGTTDPQRRIMVAGSLAAAMPLPALSARAVTAGQHPDAELLALGGRLDETMRAYFAILPAFDEARTRFAAEFDARGRGLPPLGNEECLALLLQARAPYASVLEPGEALERAWDRLADEIVRCPRPTTLAGVAVLARVVAATHREEWAKPASERDWNERIATELVSAVLALAGVENVAASAST